MLPCAVHQVVQATKVHTDLEGYSKGNRGSCRTVKSSQVSLLGLVYFLGPQGWAFFLHVTAHEIAFFAGVCTDVPVTIFGTILSSL